MLQIQNSGVRPPVAGTKRTETDDVRLIGLIAEGDRHAFEILYRNYFSRLTRFLGRMTRSPQAIEEIVNDTMLVVWQKSHTYNYSCKVSTWIFSIAYRKTLKALRAMDDPVECDPDLYPAEACHEPERETGRHELQHLLEAALDTMPAEQRVVVVLTYYHGMGYAEIAETMGCPVNTVKTRMFHARRKLKSLLPDGKEEME